MRVAPIALMADREQVRSFALEVSALTHGHPTGQYAAAAWAEMLADVANGMSLEQSAQALAIDYGQIADASETASAIMAAFDAPRDGAAETVERLGGGWTAVEALSIALYACLCAKDFDHGLQIAVTHGGDSDSTGAIAGNMLGLIDPHAALVHRWAGAIECADVITRLTRDYLRIEHDHDGIELMSEHYPGA